MTPGDSRRPRPLPGDRPRERPGAPAPTTSLRQAVLDAWYDGVSAARAGRPLTSCPHRPPFDAGQRLLALWWLRGHHAVVGSPGRGGPAPSPSDGAQ
ncbi:Rmf/CrpP family protein [Nocardioides sp. cx-173]|uniref:Rmf/CrpP family protein n=1 Tax=Nocardioides sp. cx-173 TaxID=2898796 RepID=UPI0035B16E01